MTTNHTQFCDLGPDGEVWKCAASCPELNSPLSRPDDGLAVAPPRRSTFEQLWLTLGPDPSKDAGMIRISEIVSVVRMTEPSGTPGGGFIARRRGVEILTKCGETIGAPDARYSEVKLAIMAAEVSR